MSAVEIIASALFRAFDLTLDILSDPKSLDLVGDYGAGTGVPGVCITHIYAWGDANSQASTSFNISTNCGGDIKYTVLNDIPNNYKQTITINSDPRVPEVTLGFNENIDSSYPWFGYPWIETEVYEQDGGSQVLLADLCPTTGNQYTITLDDCHDEKIVMRPCIEHDNSYEVGSVDTLWAEYYIALPWSDVALGCPTNLPGSNDKLQIMIVGDSISHGMQDDFTWRYRFWDWLKNTNGYDVKMVGPYTGTNGLAVAKQALPQPPLLPGETATVFPSTVGNYADSVPDEFASQSHAAFWGRQAAQDISQIELWVAEYEPNVIITLIGFNDMGWFVSDAEGTLASMKKLVDRSRDGNPNAKFLIGNVVQRSMIEGRDDLVQNTLQYNQLLKDAIPGWSTSQSPVVYVDVASNYDCTPSSCTDGYDGLHPDSMGEFHIAQAFANAMSAELGYGSRGFDVPATAPPRTISVPANPAAIETDEGIFTSWDEVYNTRGYWIRQGLTGSGIWWNDGRAFTTASVNWFTWCIPGQSWDTQIAAISDFNAVGDFTNTVTTVCNPKTAGGPPNIVTLPTGTGGISFTWGAVEGYDINRYEVIVWDKSVTGSYIQAYATTETSYTLLDLRAGHIYATWVATWVNLPDGNVGGGLPAAARSVNIDGPAPGVVVGLTVTNIDATSVQLQWDAAPGAAGYVVHVTPLLAGYNASMSSGLSDTSYGIGFLFPGTWHFSFCITAFNGNEETACSASVTPPVYPGYAAKHMIQSTNVTMDPIKHLNDTVESQGLQELWAARYLTQNYTTVLPS